MGPLPLVLLLVVAAPIDAGTSVLRFRTDAEPRVDAVFGNVLTLRTSIDRFLSLQGEMETVRTEFSTAVHDTLALLPGAMPSAAPIKPGPKAARTCPESAGPTYGRALTAGVRYLRLGRQLESAFREIKRGDELGDLQGLTPDYRWKAKKARDLYVQLLRDLREMRVAFYDQLGAELKFAGCKLGPAGVTPLAGDATSPVVDPSNPAAWDLAEPDAPAAAPEPERPTPTAKASTPPPDNEPTVARPIWIDVDNSHCAQPSRITIDGTPVGDVPAGKKSSVRTRAGPREVCLLPASDKRPCGAPGTVRKAYFYEGLTMTVHCGK